MSDSSIDPEWTVLLVGDEIGDRVARNAEPGDDETHRS
jgi:hypothetical protein